MNICRPKQSKCKTCSHSLNSFAFDTYGLGQRDGAVGVAAAAASNHQTGSNSPTWSRWRQPRDLGHIRGKQKFECSAGLCGRQTTATLFKVFAKLHYVCWSSSPAPDRQTDGRADRQTDGHTHDQPMNGRSRCISFIGRRQRLFTIEEIKRPCATVTTTTEPTMMVMIM